jgi:hydroxyethylthiazole kinase-like uncharacterized protein yjeF
VAGRKVLTVAEIAAADREAIAAGTPGIVLMERAGAAVADAIAERFSQRSVCVLCGPGNNGGDGYVIARLLKERGWPVEVRALAPPASADAQAAASRWDGEIAPFDAPLEARLFVDAMFGAGLARPAQRRCGDHGRLPGGATACRGCGGHPVGPAGRHRRSAGGRWSWRA